jgi:hypothetical protein
MNTHGATTTVGATTAAAHRQHSAATMAVLPLGAGPEATLEVARQLAAEQWHHDVDQLIIAAINTPPHRGRQTNRVGGGASAISGTLVLTGGTARVVSNTHNKSHYGRFVG